MRGPMPAVVPVIVVPGTVDVNVWW
jgi:hypothetical protein